MFRCEWYSTGPKCRKMVVEHNLTSLDVSFKWYIEDPFSLAMQTQQAFFYFFLSDWSRGQNWMVVQKVNHRNIYYIPYCKDDVGDLNDEAYFKIKNLLTCRPFNQQKM